MITKENLIDMLQKSFTNEDDFILSYAKDLIKDVEQSPDLGDDQKEEIKRIFDSILEDTARHRQTIKEIIEEVEGSQKDEF